MIAGCFLAAACQAGQSEVGRYAQLLDPAWFEAPHDGVIFAALAAVAGRCRPSLPLVVAELVTAGRYGREVKARCEELATVAAWPEQLPHLGAGLLAQAFRRVHGEGLAAMADHLDTDNDEEVWQRMVEHGQRVRRVWEAAQALRTPQLRAVAG